ncbi:MAG: VirB3 family type IV secretion system protein [Bryobacteraceae bacterium]
MTSRQTYKVLNRTMTVMGVEKRIWYTILGLSGATYYALHDWKLALALFVVGEFLGFLATRADDKFLDVWKRVLRVKSSYDPIKHDAFSVRVGNR